MCLDVCERFRMLTALRMAKGQPQIQGEFDTSLSFPPTHHRDKRPQPGSTRVKSHQILCQSVSLNTNENGLVVSTLVLEFWSTPNFCCFPCRCSRESSTGRTFGQKVGISWIPVFNISQWHGSSTCFGDQRLTTLMCRSLPNWLKGLSHPSIS